MHGIHYLRCISMKQIGITMAKYVNWSYLQTALIAEHASLHMHVYLLCFNREVGL